MAITLFGRPFQATSTSPSELKGRLLTPHFPCGIRFRLYRFYSPLLTVSRLISFPAPTKMFQSGAFPIITDHKGDFPLGHPRFKGSMHLAEAYRSLARPSSALEPSHPLAGICSLLLHYNSVSVWSQSLYTASSASYRLAIDWPPPFHIESSSMCAFTVDLLGFGPRASALQRRRSTS